MVNEKRLFERPEIRNFDQPLMAMAGSLERCRSIGLVPEEAVRRELQAEPRERPGCDGKVVAISTRLLARLGF